MVFGFEFVFYKILDVLGCEGGGKYVFVNFLVGKGG